MSGFVNVDGPLCRYYHQTFLRATGVPDPKGENSSNDLPKDVDNARIWWEGDVDVSGVNISFMRVPDDGKAYALPAGLSKFPLFNAADFADRLPRSIVAEGGILMSMHQCEAMWMKFRVLGDFAAYAVKISAGGLNALTGLPRNAIAVNKQDYLAIREDGRGQPMVLAPKRDTSDVRPQALHPSVLIFTDYSRLQNLWPCHSEKVQAWNRNLPDRRLVS
ncbi:uncharacterized protein PHACADRAFT_187748 [Phanerochaete carnosa HHB-10118-sp]|uniref:Uncharacterized protein n=1 Tax=Phanerochaete carnosa (strain HHB-10118-sp) TaxID=650164 RepID=K5VWI3_PHACS|nr:uncharacterized protein PHACADRAFT_187748 [Phanerochaete carnosa HHB-10118-sp]EKM51175.1 hypothetical protein PHACADRAFT_187748 [Phanerochaete carnosa HHB-10118-sp]